MKNIEYLTFGSRHLHVLCALHLKGDFDAVMQLLQGQVTSDCKLLSTGHGQPSALCNEKGYILCNFDIVIHNDLVLVIIENNSQDIFIKEITKFAPFFKVSVEPFHTDIVGWIRRPEEEGVTGEHAIIESAAAILSLVLLDSSQNEVSDIDQLPHWDIGRKVLGDHTIRSNDQGMFRPHDLNQTAHRVSFSKGCFRGQEIIARMEYLGKQKKQTQLIIHPERKAPSIFQVIGATLEAHELFFSSCMGLNDQF